MNFLSQVVSALGLGLMVVLLYRMVRNGLCKRYPLVTLYLLYALVRTLVLIYFRSAGHPHYQPIYWYTNLVSKVLWFGVAWDVHRNVITNAVLRRLAAAALCLIFFLLALGFYFANDPREYVVIETERKLGLAVATWFLFIILFAKLYALKINRNNLGIAAAGGMYLAIAVVNFSAIDLVDWFYPVLLWVRPSSFVGLLLIWVWALWKPIAPRIATDNAHPSVETIQMWQSTWDAIGSRMKRVFRP